MRIHDISVKYFLKLLVLRRRSTGVFIAGEHDKENDIWDSNVPCGASGAIIMNGKRWKHWRNTRKFIRVLEKLGVDFSDSGDNTDEKSWVNRILEQAAWVSDAGYSSRLLKTQAQINALHSQINPHFLYNTLEMIRSQALDRDVPEIADMAETLANMFRYNIGQPQSLATFEQELENVKNYFLIQQYRFQNRFELQIDIDSEDSEILECQIPRLTIQPIVENAVHHGLERRSGKGMVRISAFLTEQRLIIRISDDGAGMSRTQAEALREKLNAGMDGLITSGTRHGIALVNISERLKLYFGEEYGLSFSSAEQCGTIVELTLPRKVEKTFKNSTEKVMES